MRRRAIFPVQCEWAVIKRFKFRRIYVYMSVLCTVQHYVRTFNSQPTETRKKKHIHTLNTLNHNTADMGQCMQWPTSLKLSITFHFIEIIIIDKKSIWTRNIHWNHLESIKNDRTFIDFQVFFFFLHQSIRRNFNKIMIINKLFDLVQAQPQSANIGMISK